MAKVFVSHSWDDKPLVRDLESRLRGAGAEVWVDHAGVRGGDNLPKRISDALGWCDTLLLVWSKAASQSLWVEQEWTCAISLKRTVIPCRVDATSLPALLANRLYVDLRDREPGVKALLSALKQSIPAREAAAEAASGSLPPALPAEAGNVPEEHLRTLLPKVDEANSLVFCLGAIASDEQEDLYALLADISSRRSRRMEIEGTIFAVLSADSSLVRALSKRGQRLAADRASRSDPMLIDFSKGPPAPRQPNRLAQHYPLATHAPPEDIVFLGGHYLDTAILDYFAPVLPDPVPKLAARRSLKFLEESPVARRLWIVDPLPTLPYFHSRFWSRETSSHPGIRVVPVVLRNYIRAVKAYVATQS